MLRLARLLSIAGCFLALTTGLALAHPHIFIDAKAVIVFNDQGEVTAIKNVWTFDEAYSAWAVQGLDTNHDGQITEKEAQPLADDNMKGLAEYGFYTFVNEAGDDGTNLKLSAGPNPRIQYDGHRQTLSFTARLDKPYRIQNTLAVAINDPEYYVGITFKDKGAVALENAPKGCSFSMEAPREMDPSIAAQLYQLPADVTQLPPDLAAAVKGVQGEILVHCPLALTSSLTANGTAAQPSASAPPASAPRSALDAVNLLANTKAVPFNGPPVESTGLNLPNFPLVAWVQTQQRQFYAALTSTLAELRRDNRAFWILGVISFLYGIFHAAGPGHGKVVISSYVLANERQTRKGIVLSVISAMVQSLTAVAFILVAAGVLKMTSMAMSGTANWITIISYGMVAVLGLWLIIRHVFGLGHRHGHEDDHRGHDHDLKVRSAGESARLVSSGGPSSRAAEAHRLLYGAEASHVSRPLATASAGVAAMPEPHDHHGGHDHGHLHRHDHGRSGHHVHTHGEHDHQHEHDHVHVVTPDRAGGNWREQLGVVLAVGLRPCSGALIVLVFALSQGVLWAGIAATFLMGLGTAITVATLATIAVTAKGLARRILGYRAGPGTALVWWAELAGAVLVFAFGAILVLASF